MLSRRRVGNEKTPKTVHSSLYKLLTDHLGMERNDHGGA